MFKNMKKYPLLICLIISCVIVIGSLFVAGFCGINLSTSLGGGSQFEVSIADNVDQKTCVQQIKSAVSKKGLKCDSFTIEDKFVGTGENTQYRQKCIVVKLTTTNISDEDELEVRKVVAEDLDINIEQISAIDNIVSSIKSKDILFLGLGIGVIAICLFVFGWVRYSVFAGLSFILAFIHNIILFLAVTILTRIPLSLVSIAAIMVLSVLMSAVMISIFEKYKLQAEMHLAEKETPSIRMINSQKTAIKPYIFVCIATLVFALLLFFVQVTNINFSALSIIIALVVSSYTALLIGPGVYAGFLDIQNMNLEARLSRNDTINKVIKKKIESSKKNTSKKK